MRFWPRRCKKASSRDEARQALERERIARQDVDSQALELEAQQHMVNELVNSLEKRRAENHFAQLIRRSLS